MKKSKYKSKTAGSKIRSRSSVEKRFKMTASGQIRTRRGCKQHGMLKRSTSSLNKPNYRSLSLTETTMVKRMLAGNKI